MRIKATEIKAGDFIVWKGKGLVYNILKWLLKFYDPTWDMWGWHTGYVVIVLPTEEIVVSEAIAEGVESVIYPYQESLGQCRIYRWLDNSSQERINAFAESHQDYPYDPQGYIWTLAGALSGKFFNHPFRVVNKRFFCWENISQFARYMGKEFQEEGEPVLLSKIVKRLERI